VTSVIVAAGWLDWLGTNTSERQLSVFLMVVGVVASGTVVRLAIRSHRVRLRRRRQDNPPTTPNYSSEPLPVRYAAALGVGALRAAAVAEPVNALAYQRSRRLVRADLIDQLVDAHETGDRVDAARQAISRTLNALLGARAELVGEGLQLVEEVLRRRALVGVDLWRHDLDEFASRQGLVLTDRIALHRAADDVERAEEWLRSVAVFGPIDRVPTLLAVHWAAGVHLTRDAWRVRWINEADALARLDRAGELLARWYPSWRAVLGALLLPDLFAQDEQAAHRGATLAGQLLTDPRSPLSVPLGESPSLV
jgi:hypothetical protein